MRKRNIAVVGVVGSTAVISERFPALDGKPPVWLTLPLSEDAYDPDAAVAVLGQTEASGQVDEARAADEERLDPTFLGFQPDGSLWQVGAEGSWSSPQSAWQVLKMDADADGVVGEGARHLREEFPDQAEGLLTVIREKGVEALLADGS